jgi:hypothetical protein
MDVCRTQAPPSFPVAQDHTAECWLLDPTRADAAAAATSAAGAAGRAIPDGLGDAVALGGSA